MQKSAKKAMRGGFTLIEILVVLVIMGFLVAMVAPKLSGIVDSAVDTTCDTNQERLRGVLNAYVNQNNGLPGGLVNMVKYQNDTTVAANVAIPDGDNSNKADGKEFLSWELVERMKPQVHFIDAAEADEIKALGIGSVHNLAKVVPANFADTTGTAEDDKIEEGMVRQGVAAGLPVFMIGVGMDDTGAVTTWSTGNEVATVGSAVTETAAATAINAATLGTDANVDGTFVRFDEGKNVGRIVMGISNQGELVQGGMLEEAGTCPGQVQRADHHTWGNYLVILPRLGSTMDRLGVSKLNAIALDTETGESATGAKISGRTPTEGYHYFAAQEVSAFTTSCPEGHTWGAVADAYAISIQ